MAAMAKTATTRTDTAAYNRYHQPLHAERQAQPQRCGQSWRRLSDGAIHSQD
eukprot:jgi/Chlat1/1916/Chrsp149S02223